MLLRLGRGAVFAFPGERSQKWRVHTLVASTRGGKISSITFTKEPQDGKVDGLNYQQRSMAEEANHQRVLLTVSEYLLEKVPNLHVIRGAPATRTVPAHGRPASKAFRYHKCACNFATPLLFEASMMCLAAKRSTDGTQS